MSNGIEVFPFSIQKVLKKYWKWFLKKCGNPVATFRFKSLSLRSVLNSEPSFLRLRLVTLIYLRALIPIRLPSLIHVTPGDNQTTNPPVLRITRSLVRCAARASDLLSVHWVSADERT